MNIITTPRKRRYGGFDVSGLTREQRALFERARTSGMSPEEAASRLAKLSPSAPYLLRQALAIAAVQPTMGKEVAA